VETELVPVNLNLLELYVIIAMARDMVLVVQHATVMSLEQLDAVQE